MATLRLLKQILLIALLTYLVGGCIGAFVFMQVRLHRNGKVAQQLLESLEPEFPKVKFRAGPYGEQDLVIVDVFTRLDDTERQAVETWLRKHKVEQKIRPQIQVRFSGDDPEKPTLVIE